MSTSEECKDGSSTKSNNNGVCEVIDSLQKLSTADVPVCANCGKEGEDVNNICNKCKKVKYCNAVCKKVHKKKHKKDCEEYIRLATEKHDEELRIAAELHDIELLKQPPPTDEDCPICFIRLPTLSTGLEYQYQSCCGKVICSGCDYAPLYDNQGNQVDNEKCPFCRTPTPSSEKEMINRYKKRMELDDPMAIHSLGSFYREGLYGFPQDYTKALELYLRSGELGYTEAHCFVGYAYLHGDGVEVDEKKAKHYWKLASMRGNVNARYNLGIAEHNAGNLDRAFKHFMIAVRGGHAMSLNEIKEMYSKGHAAKDDYTKALQLYQAYLSEIKSVQRDKAAAADEKYRYY